jgi:ATP-binding cassette, subfamily B, bacterial
MSRPAASRGARATARSLRRVLARLAPDIRGQRLLIAGGLVALLAEVAFRLLEPWPMKFIVDRVAEPDPGRASTGVGWADRLDPITLLLIAAAAVVAFAGLRAAFSYLSTVAFALAGNRVLTSVRGRMYAHLQRLSLGWHSRARTGDLIARITGDIGRLQEVAVTAALPLVGNVIAMAGMFAVMVWIDPFLALIAMAALPPFAFLMARRTRELRSVSREQRRHEGELATSAAEALGAMRVVQSYSLEEALDRAFASKNRKSLREGVRARRLAAGLERKTDVLAGLATGLVLFFGARQVLVGAMTPGDLVVFALYLRSAFKPMRDMAKYTGRMARAAASGERIIDVLDEVPEIRDAPGAVAAPPLRGEIEWDGVTLEYELGHEALRDVRLRVAAGERLALVGPSGGGKSSLASLVPRLYDPTRGRVLVDGRDVREYTLASLRGQVAVVLQESVLFATTVRENIAHGSPEATEEEIVAAARLANAHDFITALPEGYDTVLGERGATLSGGQRQRIAIARAAVRRAAIVILDEPTAGLDRRNALEVEAALARLTEGRTTIVIAHDLDAARSADRIAVIADGRVAEEGTHGELMAEGGRYAAMLAIRRLAERDGDGARGRERHAVGR